MLGRHHAIISLSSAAVLLVPFFNTGLELIIYMLIGVVIGSLVPDADSPDAAIFHDKIRGLKGYTKMISYYVGLVLPLFGNVTKHAIYRPSMSILSRTFLKKYEITQQHRGFLHSFIGIGCSTILTSVYLIIVLYLISLLTSIKMNYLGIALFMLAYLFGALMHILEDSCTVTGIQFNYPYSNLILKGSLITRPQFAEIPDMFGYVLGASAIGLYIGIEAGFITFAPWMIALLALAALALAWIVFLVFFAHVQLVRGELHRSNSMKSML
jgi:inner membrane protein